MDHIEPLSGNLRAEASWTQPPIEARQCNRQLTWSTWLVEWCKDKHGANPGGSIGSDPLGACEDVMMRYQW